jgi:hypothetical protein
VSEKAGSASIALTTPDNSFKLGPASFVFNGTSETSGPLSPPLTVSADVDQFSLEVPLDPGGYTVTLQPGWTLQQGATDANGNTQWTPVAATLTSPNPQAFPIEAYLISDVQFAFHLGVSEVRLGISVTP